MVGSPSITVPRVNGVASLAERHLAFAAGLGCQNAGSAAIHSFDGKLQEGRTAKTFDSVPTIAAAASASSRFWAGTTIKRVPLAPSNTVPLLRRLPLVTVITRKRPWPRIHGTPVLRSWRYLAKTLTGFAVRLAFFLLFFRSADMSTAFLA